MAFTMDDQAHLPWASIRDTLRGRRCKARLANGTRCELVRNHNHPATRPSPTVLHALERGMDTPRWSTEWVSTR